MFKLHRSCIFKRLHLVTYTKFARYSTHKVNVRKIKKLEKSYAIFSKSCSESLLKKHLTKTIFDRLKKKTTSFNSTLLDCVQSGFCNLDSVIGVYAPDAEAYKVFAELFDPIIEDYHKGFKKACGQPPTNFGDLSYFANIDPRYRYVASTKIHLIRSLAHHAFNPSLQINQYPNLQNVIVKCLCGLEKDLKGKYYSLSSLDSACKSTLRKSNYLFEDGNKFLRYANALKGWPLGRGIYIDKDKTFFIWVNEEDHIRIISEQEGGDFKTAYTRLVKAVNLISSKLNFTRDSKLGFLTSSPANIGTTIRASVHIKLPKLSKDKAKFEEVAAKFNLQIRGTSGEHSESIGGVYDISNKQRIGLTEYQAVKTMQDGILEMIKIEQSL